jgi:hypothetical protein
LVIRQGTDCHTRITNPGPIFGINHALSDVLLDCLCQKDQASVASDSSQDLHGNVSPRSQLLEVLPEPSDTVSKHSYIYNKAGVKFLAKDALSSVPQTRAMTQENGPIYQGQKIESYMLPCDEMEQDRLDFFPCGIPTCIISKGKVQIQGWCQDYASPSDRRIEIGANGWTTDEIGLQWL